MKKEIETKTIEWFVCEKCKARFVDKIQCKEHEWNCFFKERKNALENLLYGEKPKANIFGNLKYGRTLIVPAGEKVTVGRIKQLSASSEIFSDDEDLNGKLQLIPEYPVGFPE